MASPYTSVPVANYNSNPPTDDGSSTAANKVTWSKHKAKLHDPLKLAVETISDNANSSFGVVAGGVLVVATATHAIAVADQHKIIVATVPGSVFTMPDPTEVESPFQVTISNITGADMSILPFAAETLDGFASLTMRTNGGVTLRTDSNRWYSLGRNYELTTDSASANVRAPEGYLTLTSLTPVITGDVAAATSVYYTPDKGAQTPISDGMAVQMNTFTELTLTLSASHLASQIYDVFIFKNSGVITIGTGPAWTTTTAGAGSRGAGAATTELERWNGFLVNKYSMTVRNGATTYTVAARAGIYLGTLFMDSTNGQITCHRSWGQNRKWGVWNYYNRRQIQMKMGDPTATWLYFSAVWRQVNAAAGNTIAVMVGLDETIVTAEFTMHVNEGSANYYVGVGWNTTTTYTGTFGHRQGVASVSTIGAITGRHSQRASLGRSNVNAVENCNGSNGLGTEAHMTMFVAYAG